MRKTAGDLSQQVIIRILDDPNGTPELGVTSATGGLALYFWRRGALISSFTIVSTLGGLASAFDVGGLTSIINGYYRLDVPNSAFATGSSGVFVGGFATSMILIGQDIDLVTDDTEELEAHLDLLSAALSVVDANVDTVSTILSNVASSVALILEDTNSTLSSQLILILEDTNSTLASQLLLMQGATFDTATDSLEAIRNNQAGADLAAITSAVWSSVLADFVTAGTTGAGLLSAFNLATLILEDTNSSLNSQLLLMQGATFATGTDSLEAIRNRGDAAWTTGAGGSSPEASAIASAVLSAVLSDYDVAGTVGGNLLSAFNLATLIVGDTNELQTDDIPGLIAALNDLSQNQVSTIVNSIFNTYDAPTNAEMVARFDTLSGAVSVVDANVDAILLDTGTDGVLVASGAIGSSQFAAGAIDAAALAADAATEIANAAWAKVLETQGSITAQQIMQVVLAVIAGVTADGGATFKTPNGVATRVAATINGSQERTAMTLTP